MIVILPNSEGNGTKPGMIHRPDHDRRFDFTITYDRPLVTAAAHNLLDRITNPTKSWQDPRLSFRHF
jgi:hypothetical protein